MKRQKEPGLLKKIIDIHFEQAKRRKHLRQLEKQSWSLDFLALLLVKANRISSDITSLKVYNKDGQYFVLECTAAKKAVESSSIDDSIFNHLDDDLAVQHFIRDHSVR